MCPATDAPECPLVRADAGAGEPFCGALRRYRQPSHIGTPSANCRDSMSLSALSKVIVCASLTLACGQMRQQEPLTPSAPVNTEYITIIPEVTYSPTGQGRTGGTASAVSDDGDVMAGILAIPRGSQGRHAPCSECRTEAFHDATR